MTISRYSGYKNCASTLVNEIPSSWNKSRVRLLTSIQKGRLPATTYTESHVNSDLPYLSMEYLRGEKEVLSSIFVPVDESAIKAQDKDILILWDGSNAGEILRAKQGVVSSTLARVLPNGIDRDYLFFSLKSVEKLLKDQSIGMGIPHVSSEVLKDLSVFVPPIDEQRTIARFLDHETSKIGKLISEQEILIELLKEKRQTVISHAVTKGLDPNVKMKSSGNKWIGLIPSHWKTIKIKWVAKMESGHTPDKKVQEYWGNESDIPWVSLNDTGFLKNNDYISDTCYQITAEGIENSSARILPKDVVVFSRDATIGRCAITTRPMAVSQHFIAWICGSEIVPEYLLFRFRSMTGELNSYTTGATLKTIGMPDVRTLTTPLPTIEEQRRIVYEIQHQLIEIDKFISLAETNINLLSERREALILSAVTGQVDVRNVANAMVEAA